MSPLDVSDTEREQSCSTDFFFLLRYYLDVSLSAPHVSVRLIVLGALHETKTALNSKSENETKDPSLRSNSSHFKDSAAADKEKAKS